MARNEPYGDVMTVQQAQQAGHVHAKLNLAHLRQSID
jgi:hypothetical protein